MSPKYRHRGYRDSESDERERPKSPPKSDLTKEERIQKRSLRHAIDRKAHAVLRCHDCGRTVQDLEIVSAETNCPHCGTALHCCRACRHFDASARWQCSAEITEAVANKIAANRCTSFHPNLVLDVTGRRTPSGRSGDPKSQFEDLFKR